MAQYDMYELLSREHELMFASTAEWKLLIDKADLIWLGIYHQTFPIDWDEFCMTDKPVIIDNADNEEFVEKNGIIPYRNIKRKIFTSRYLPNEGIIKLSHILNVPLMQLSWYINSNRFKPAKKDIDVVFIASMTDERKAIAEKIERVCKVSGWSYYIGMDFDNYAHYLSRAKVLFCECARKCLTQKYIEGIYSGCVLVGDVPIYPENNVEVIPADKSNITEALRSALNGKTQDYKSSFLSDFNKILNELLLV